MTEKDIADLIEFFDVKVVVGLIALLGVFVSAVVSAGVAIVQTRRSEKNLRIELEKKFNEHLYKKRIEVYPELYFAISELGKYIRKPEMKYSEANLTLNRIEEWDSKFAIFVSPMIINLLLKMRNNIVRTETNDPNSIISDYDREEMFKNALRLEQALKNEIGVYSLDGYHQEDVNNLRLHSWKYPFNGT